MNTKNKLMAEASITIDAKAAKVWGAITTPATIEKYLFGTHVKTDWKEGSPIEYAGEHEGKSYHDKGIIRKMVPEKLFVSTYWSSMGGKEDKPENYNEVTYKLDERDGKTDVTITQDNIETDNEKKHAAQNWGMVLQNLKKVVEV